MKALAAQYVPPDKDMIHILSDMIAAPLSLAIKINTGKPVKTASPQRSSSPNLHKASRQSKSTPRVHGIIYLFSSTSPVKLSIASCMSPRTTKLLLEPETCSISKALPITRHRALADGC